MEYKENTYTILPTKVLNAEDIGDGEKLLFSLLYSLSHRKGHCWANNATLSESLVCSQDTLRRRLKNLEDNGYIMRKYYDVVINHENRTMREIHIVEEKKIERQAYYEGIEEETYYEGDMHFCTPGKNQPHPPQKSLPRIYYIIILKMISITIVV